MHIFAVAKLGVRVEGAKIFIMDLNLFFLNAWIERLHVFIRAIKYVQVSLLIPLVLFDKRKDFKLVFI